MERDKKIMSLLDFFSRFARKAKRELLYRFKSVRRSDNLYESKDYSKQYKYTSGETLDLNNYLRKENQYNVFTTFQKPIALNNLTVKLFINAEILSQNGLGLTNTGKLIPELNLFSHTREIDISFLKKCRVSTPIYVDNICSLIDPGRNNYFHWFLDTVTRIFGIESVQPKVKDQISLLLPSSLKDWQLDSLRLLGYTDKNFIFINSDVFLRTIANRLYVPSPSRVLSPCQYPMGTIYPESIRILQRRFTNAKKAYSGESSKFLYVSREDSSSRRIENENEFLEFLGNLGFEKVILSNYSLEEQISMFYNAKAIIAVHGAGLTNLLFGKDLTVIEIHSKNHGLRADFCQICNALNFNYRYYVSDSINENNDIHININEFKNFLKQAKVFPSIRS